MSHCVIHDTSEPSAQQYNAVAPTQSSSTDSERNNSEALLACAALELIPSIVGSDSVEVAATRLVNQLKVFLNADGVAIGTVVRGGGCRLVAVAGSAEFQAGSPMAAAITAALRDTVGDVQNERSPDTLFFAGGSQRFAELRALVGNSEINGVRLAIQSCAVVGALLLWGKFDSVQRSRCERFLGLGSEPLAAAFDLLERRNAGPLRRALGRVGGSRRWLVCAALAVIAIGCLFLLPHRISCECVAEPLAQRFVCAPFAGVFEKSLVRPGDNVAKDQILGKMDEHDLRLELAAVSADAERARKSYDVDLASDKVAAAQIDRLELERLEQQKQLIEHRMSNLAIRSPVAGYVIGGELQRKEGSPLTIGQVLYEIAPLDQMIVELAIDPSDIAWVQAGQQVTMRFEACAGDSATGRIVRIHPRSETRDSRNVFIGEVALADSTDELRPGMKGQARVVIEGESLGSGLCKRAWFRLASFFGL